MCGPETDGDCALNRFRFMFLLVLMTILSQFTMFTMFLSSSGCSRQTDSRDMSRSKIDFNICSLFSIRCASFFQHRYWVPLHFVSAPNGIDGNFNCVLLSNWDSLDGFTPSLRFLFSLFIFFFCSYCARGCKAKFHFGYLNGKNCYLQF